MILAAKYSRESKTPYFGICLGLQIAIIDIARSLCGLKVIALNLSHAAKIKLSL